MSETLEHKMEEPPTSAPQATDAHLKPAGKISGLERVTLGAVSAGWKMPLLYSFMASSSVYAPYALPAALAVGAAFFSLNYFGFKYLPIGKLYQAIKDPIKKTIKAVAKDMYTNGKTYAKNFLTATTSLLENLVTFPAKILPVYGAASPGAVKGVPQPAH